MKIIAIRFHRRTLEDRIKTSEQASVYIGKLKAAAETARYINYKKKNRYGDTLETQASNSDTQTDQRSPYSHWASEYQI